VTARASPPEGMDVATYRRIDRLPAEQRYRVLERAAIIRDGTGCTWGEADRRALAEEIDQRRLPGVR
jgi:hypothetical protein